MSLTTAEKLKNKFPGATHYYTVVVEGRPVGISHVHFPLEGKVTVEKVEVGWCDDSSSLVEVHSPALKATQELHFRTLDELLGCYDDAALEALLFLRKNLMHFRRMEMTIQGVISQLEETMIDLTRSRQVRLTPSEGVPAEIQEGQFEKY